MPVFSILGRMRQAVLSYVSPFFPTDSIRLLALGLMFLEFTCPAHSAQVSLGWNANTEPELRRLTGVTAGQTYYFAVKAYAHLGQNESAFSGEVQATISIPTGSPLSAFSASTTSGTAASNGAFTDSSTSSVTAWN